MGVSAETMRKIDQAIKKLDTEENQASNLRSQISANLGYRQELREIQRVQKELDEIDLEAAAKARREFNSKYKAMLEDENEKQGKVSSGLHQWKSADPQWNMTSGELMQMKKNTQALQTTLKADYENIDAKYKEQLIKTKVGDAEPFTAEHSAAGQRICEQRSGEVWQSA